MDWFFSTEDVEALDNLVLPMPTEPQNTESQSNASLLLGNIRKVEGIVYEPVEFWLLCWRIYL